MAIWKHAPFGFCIALVMVWGLMLPVSGGGAMPAHTSPTLPVAAREQSCPPIPGPYGALNSTLFEEICSQSQFQAALQEWGLNNFTASEFVSRTSTVVYLGFNWVEFCSNSTGSVPRPQCAFQEDWGANITSGTVSGPTLSEHPLACACGAEIGGTQSPVLLELVDAAAASIIALAVLTTILLRRRASRGRPPRDANKVELPPT